MKPSGMEVVESRPHSGNAIPGAPVRRPIGPVARKLDNLHSEVSPGTPNFRGAARFGSGPVGCFEVAIPFRQRLRGVALVDPDEPLPPARLDRDLQPADDQRPLAESPTTCAAPDPAELQERQAVEAVLANLERLGNDLRAQQGQRLKDMQQVAVELALAVASHLVQKQLVQNEFPIEHLVARVAERLEPQQPATLFLNPDDLNLLEARGGEAGHDFLKANPDLRLLADASLARGDCRAETGDLTIVSRLEEQLNDLRAGLLETLPEAQVERRAQRATTIRRFPDRRHTA